MSNRPLLAGTPTVEVDQYRYDELLHKEALLSGILRLAANNTTLISDFLLLLCAPVCKPKEEENDD